MSVDDCYNSDWYLQVVCPHYRTYTDDQITFNYEKNSRCECASPYGYGGITCSDVGSIRGVCRSIRAALGSPIFIRHKITYAPTEWADYQFRQTRVIPCKDPWQEGCALFKEERRAERLGITAEVQGSERSAILAFKAGYLASMESKHAAPKYHALADRIEQWAGNERVCVVSTQHSGALFLIGNDGWAHYHLAYRGIDAHGTESYAIFALAIPWLSKLGIENVHLGGGMTDSPDDPLYRFKERIGRIPHKVYFQEIP